MLGVMCFSGLLQLVRVFLLVLSVIVFFAYRLCILMCAPTETRIPTATKRLNTSHQAFTSIYYNLH